MAIQPSSGRSHGFESKRILSHEHQHSLSSTICRSISKQWYIRWSLHFHTSKGTESLSTSTHGTHLLGVLSCCVLTNIGLIANSIASTSRFPQVVVWTVRMNMQHALSAGTCQQILTLFSICDNFQ